MALVELRETIGRHAVRDVLGIFLDRAIGDAADRILQRLAGAVRALQPALGQSQARRILVGKGAVRGNRGRGDARTNLLASLGDDVAHAGSGVGAACDRRWRQVGIAELDGDPAGRDAEPIGGGERDDRIGAIADLVRGGLHLGGALRRHGDPRRGGGHLRWVHRRGAAPADQLVAVAHRSRFWIALLPAKGFRRRIKARHQRAAGVRQVLDRLVVGVVASSQLDRVHVERNRQLIHRRFQRKQIRRLGRRAHKAGGVAVGMHDRNFRDDVRAGVKPCRGVGTGHLVIVGPAGDLLALMDQPGD